jgi:hypothetical protein
VELQRTLDKIRAQGLGLAAISYDSVALLKNFAERRGITFPLLSDADSSIIKAFHILNEEVPPGTPFSGIPYPGTYIVDREGRVLAKYFEENYVERYTASDILVRQFGTAAGAAQASVETKHLSLSTAASTDRVSVGQRLALTVDVDMKPGMHVYAPGVGGYIPLDWSIKKSPTVVAHPVDFPASKKLHLPVIDETVPVFTGRFRLVRDVTVGEAPPGPLTIEGTFKYQACDDHLCYMPQTVPLKWEVQVLPGDRERAPTGLRRKSGS